MKEIFQRLNGAESDDPYYKRGYPVKNTPIDSINELLLIKIGMKDICSEKMQMILKMK